MEHGREQRMFLTMEKMDLILRTLLETFNVQVNENLSDLLFLRNMFFFLSIFHRIYFRQDFSVILFPETLLAVPILFYGKKSQESNSGLYFRWHFVLGLQKSCYFLFFQNLFSMTFFHRFVLFSLLKYKAKAGALCLYIIRFGRV